MKLERMGGVDTALGLTELLGTITVVLLLLWATVARSERITLFGILAVVFGIVFANPFGLVARESLIDPGPTTPTAAADTARRWVEVAGVPVAWFEPYKQEFVYSGENSPTAALKLRYGFSFLPSTGASTVAEMCSDSILVPCWKGDYPLIRQDSGGKTWIVPLTSTPVANTSQYVHVAHFYDVHFAVASRRAFFYWVVVAALIAFGATRSRIRWRSVGLAAGGSVLVGILIAVALGASPTPPRGFVPPDPISTTVGP